ncbi:hypothetical protein COOONC_16346 [Cooperia oncophora]
MWVQLPASQLFLFISFYYALAGKLVGPATESSNSENLPTETRYDVPAEWSEMCEFLERDWQGEEGQINDERFRLRGVTVVFRHGERSPLHTVEDAAGCLPFREQDRQDFEMYKKLIESDDFNFFLRTDSALFRWTNDS